MRLKSIGIIFYTAAVVIIVFSITLTVLQDSFIHQSASLKFLFWQTQEFPMILFVSGAFLVGLLMGLVVAVFDNVQNRRVINDLRKNVIKTGKSIK